ncbi:LysR family transcriptional regulator [Ornithinibacillus halotolerans]|uniref:LysR family transcriptional regulator n=1 Tax=Ornithinibacillus halotolerans TaxID=1274357 RepID=A0A916SA27_9BACI|nr:LysR family transcriptional regulator [Ornithinibacillus halotolerans]GGA91324.1 LysR family transcriptional regulator [Ornithinibacillus halotolerans]
MYKKDYALLLMLDEERNMTKAAEKLFISQPNLTYKLRQIETFFNTEIFIRDRSGLIPTPEGELIIKMAKENLRNIETTLDEIQLMEKSIRGTIKLGVASTFGQYILPTILKEFQSIYPEVNFEIITGLSSKIFKHFTAGDVHIAILRGEHVWEEEQYLLVSEPINIVSKTKIDLVELPNHPGIEYEMDSYLKGIVEAWWKDIFTKPSKISMSVHSLETAKEMARVGLGYTILPGICLMNEKELTIQNLYDSNHQLVKRDTWAYCRKKTLHFPPVREFLEYLKEHTSDLTFDYTNTF